MITYHKIQTVFKRNPETNFKTLLDGEFALPEFEYLKNNIWVYTEKVDGTNIRIMFNGFYFRFHGRTDNSQIPIFLLNELNKIFLPLKDKFSELFPNGVCLYGEGYGAKIQKGGDNYRQDQSFVLFDIKIGNWWLKRIDVEDIATKLNIDIVPIIGRGNLENMIAIAKMGFNSIWGNFKAEGIVARPGIELIARSGHRIITKIKHKDFS